MCSHILFLTGLSLQDVILGAPSTRRYEQPLSECEDGDVDKKPEKMPCEEDDVDCEEEKPVRDCEEGDVDCEDKKLAERRKKEREGRRERKRRERDKTLSECNSTSSSVTRDLEVSLETACEDNIYELSVGEV